MASCAQSKWKDQAALQEVNKKKILNQYAAVAAICRQQNLMRKCWHYGVVFLANPENSVEIGHENSVVLQLGIWKCSLNAGQKRTEKKGLQRLAR